MTVALLGVALGLTFLAAATFYPALGLAPGKRVGVLLPVCALILLAPAIIPPDAPFLRFLAAVNAVAVSLKLYDLNRAAEREPRPSWRSFLLFLPNWSALVFRKLGTEPDPARADTLRRLTRGVIELGCGVVLVVALFRVDWAGQPFALQHFAKVIAVHVALFALSVALVSLWRLAGGKARDFMNMPFLAATPGDFWKRYNRGVYQFAYENVFKPAGGMRAPIRASLATFAVSAIVHEYMFGIAIGRVTGYQTLFFLLQGLAVSATASANPAGWARLPWTAGTLGFTLATSVLFFASVNGLLPFYSGPLPSWLWAR